MSTDTYALPAPLSAPDPVSTPAPVSTAAPASSSTLPRVLSAKELELAARLEQLGQRQAPRPAPRPAADGGKPSGGKKRRRHAARKTRIAAAALSLLTTGGLTAAFAATDVPGNSVIVASGAPIISVATGSAVESTYVGDVLSNKWGPVQVQATFAADGSLASVDAVQVPFADNKSVRINNNAVPTLNAEALQSQSASVDSVSGATYTSVDYERSLQSAIDAARSDGVTTLA